MGRTRQRSEGTGRPGEPCPWAAGLPLPSSTGRFPRVTTSKVPPRGWADGTAGGLLCQGNSGTGGWSLIDPWGWLGFWGGWIRLGGSWGVSGHSMVMPS
jgi:hypothetical protein